MPQATIAQAADAVRALTDAVSEAGEVIRMIGSSEAFDALTCTEADALASVFATAGATTAAVRIIRLHGLGDEHPDEYDTEDTHAPMAETGFVGGLVLERVEEERALALAEAHVQDLDLRH